MSAPSDADVIIAGAGIAGTTLALALKSGGLSAILIDPQPFEAQVAPTFDGRASAISFSAFLQWRAVGAGDYLAPQLPRTNHIYVHNQRSIRSPTLVHTTDAHRDYI